MTLEERFNVFVQRKVNEHNSVSATLKYAGVKTDYYEGRLTELQNILIDFAWQFGVNVNFVTAIDGHGNEYEKAIIAE